LADLAEENVSGVTACVVTTDLFRHGHWPAKEVLSE